MTKTEAYRILGLPLESPTGTIKSSFRELALAHHPDTGDGSPEFPSMIKAYNLLTGEEMTQEMAVSHVPSTKELRIEHFIALCKGKLLGEDPDMLQLFIEHWTESGDDQKKFRAEFERVFNHKKRFNTWKRNSKDWARPASSFTKHHDDNYRNKSDQLSDRALKEQNENSYWKCIADYHEMYHMIQSDYDLWKFDKAFEYAEKNRIINPSYDDKWALAKEFPQQDRTDEEWKMELRKQYIIRYYERTN